MKKVLVPLQLFHQAFILELKLCGVAKGIMGLPLLPFLLPSDSGEVAFHHWGTPFQPISVRNLVGL